MLDNTATSAAVTSSRDACDSDVTDDVTAVNVSHMIVGECDVDTADVSSVSSVTSRAGGTDAASRLGQRSACRVCADNAAGMYFGALVCVPCKTFFLRYAGDGDKFKCKYVGSCDVSVATRTHCKCCRYEKCLRVGMRRRVRPAQVEIIEGQQLCAICSDVGNGIHFGVITCEGCKKFFRRGLVEYVSYRCKNEGRCVINPQTRNLCRFCRYQKCIAAGMSRNAIQMGRPTKYTSPAGGNGVRSGPTEMTTTSSSSSSHLGSLITPWLQVLSPQSLLQQQLLVHRHSLRPADAVNPWLMTSRDVSLSPDSTVKELEQSSSDSESVMKHCAHQAVDLCQKSAASSVAVNVSQIPSGVLESISASNVASTSSPTVKCRQSLQMEIARLWSRCTNTHIGSLTRHTSEPVLNLSVKPLQLCRQNSSDTTTSLTSFSHADDDSDDDSSVEHCANVRIDKALSVSLSYWLQLSLHNIDDLFIGHHWELINAIVPVYDRFLHHGTCLNRTLREEFEDLCKVSGADNLSTLLPVWIKDKVIPAYTVASVNYFQSLPGFKSFDSDDQATIIRLGQSASRVVLAAVHWYDVDLKLFRNFLAWRSSSLLAVSATDLFKQQLIDYAESISLLDLDPIEAALLNALLIIATDYPNLRNSSVIDNIHAKILSALHAYTAAKYGLPNSRLKMLFSCVPYARRLGLLHYQMTRTRSVSAEEVATKSSSSSTP